ncbi:MAG: hypothetical protein WC656_01825 [Sulfurimonas sp.]
MFELVQNNKLIYWRIVLSAAFVLLSDAVLKLPFEYSIGFIEYSLFFVLTLMASFAFIDKSKMQKIVNLIDDEEFFNKFTTYSRCFIYTVTASIFFTFLIVIIVYESKPETPVFLIEFISLSICFATLYLVRRFNIKASYLCNK